METLQNKILLCHFHYLKLPIKMTIYPPEHHAEIIAVLYKHIGFNPEICPIAELPNKRIVDNKKKVNRFIVL